MLIDKKMIRIISSLLIIFIIFTFSCVLASDDTVYVWSTETEPLEDVSAEISNEVNETSENINKESEQDSETTSAETEENSLDLESASAILIEQETGEILYEHNIHEKLRPASVTKVMSLLLIMEAIDSGQISLEDKVPCTEDAAGMGGSQIWLEVGEELTVDEMLKAICVVSANDCTVAMANYICGSQEAFVDKMNEKAQELGMNDTTFKNCHGIDEDGHVTSAYDIALMSKELLNNYPSITNYTTIWIDTLRNGESELVNTNRLIRNYKGATGLKTGSTSIALYNLSASATRDGLSLIAVIMKAPTSTIRFSEAQELLNYGFSNYQYKELEVKGSIIKEASVTKGINENVNLVLENDIGIFLKKGEDKNIEQVVNIEENLVAPLYEGQKVGEIIYKLNGEEIRSSNIVCEKTIERKTFFTMALYVYKNCFSLLRYE